MASHGENTGSEPSRQAPGGLPADRYDEIKRTGRIGAHRVQARPRYFWQFLIAGIAAFVVLTAAGIFWVQGLDGSNPFSDRLGTEETAEPTQAPEPEIDPEAEVAVLNGTETLNLASAVDSIITEEQWGTIIFSGDAASHDVTTSAVFYREEDDLAAAQGLAAKLGGMTPYKTDDYADYGARLIVLLGDDYQGPGLDEAAELTAQTETPNADGGSGTDGDSAE
ncbi:LytR C-terminal domain-containing protein [Leucobacter sp. GX24907]